MYDDRTRHARHIIEEVEARYGIPVLQPPVRKSIRFAEAPGTGEVHPPACAQLAGGARLPPAGPHARSRRAWSAGTVRIVPDGPDPLGKRALFWMPVDAESPRTGDEPARVRRRTSDRASGPRPACGHGRPASTRLYSEATPAGEPEAATSAATATDPLPPRGLFTVACSSCGSVSRVGLVEFLCCSFPFGPGSPGERSTGG